MEAGRKRALLIATETYSDARFRQLRTPTADVEALSAVLRDPRIGDYSVLKCANVSESQARRTIADFFAEGRPDDLLLLYISGHGVKDDDGQLYFAVTDSVRDRLMATAVSAVYVREQARRSRAGRIVLWLDCCFAGAFPAGLRDRAGEDAEVLAQLSGRGTAVMTASSELQYAFEPDGETVEITAEPGLSVFTGVLTDGLRAGDADRNGDGWIDIDELYDFVYDRVRAITPNQTPQKKFAVEGTIYIAANPRAMLSPPVAQAGRSQLDHRMTALVRECLLKPPQPNTLTVVSHNKSKGRTVRIARAAHPLEDDEDLIAFWQFKSPRFFSSDPSGLVFTSRSIRIFDRRKSSELRITIPYRDFNRYTFTYETRRQSVRTSPYSSNSVRTYTLLIDGPNRWGLPASETNKFIVDDLNNIKKIAAGDSTTSGSEHRG